MSYTPVPAGGIEPPRDGATTRCLPTWLSRRARGVGGAAARSKKSRGSRDRTCGLARRMRPPLYRLSYSAILQWWPLWLAPLGFEPRPPSSKPGALPARRRGKAMVPRAGFEPAPSDLKDRRPRPLDERGDGESGSRQSAIEPLLPDCRLPIAQNMADGAGIEPARPEGLGALASRCLTTRPTIRDGQSVITMNISTLCLDVCRYCLLPTCPNLVSVDGFEPPISCFQGRQGRPGSPTRC